MTSIRDGQFKLNEFLLVDATAKTIDCGKAEDLTPLCVQANIYESVLEPCVRAEFEFYDAKGAGELLIFTNKKIVIDFTTDEDNPKSAIRYEFYIVGEPVRVQSADDKALIYKVECVTYEAYKSTDIKNAPLVRKKIECEKMVKAYLEILGSQKSLFAEKTRGLHAFNFTVKTPFECIDEIRLEYAMSQEFKGHAFYFFENKHGYVFKSMELLIKEGKENIGDKCFMQSTLTNLDVTGSKWRNILTTKLIQKGNEGIAKLIGAGAGKVKQFNKVTGATEDFQADPKNLEFQTLNKGSASTTLKAQVEKAKDGNEGQVKEITFDPSISNIERAEKFNHLPYYMAHFLTVIMQITIYGDSTITAGDVIKCQFPEATGLTRGEKNPINEDSAMTTGNYVVTKCRHMLTFNEKAEYAQGLELVKDGIGGEPQTHTS
jgi:hypothetical protein